MSASHLIAFDLGTGGIKAALYASDGACLAEVFAAYTTFYPRPGWHEQSPEDWWQALVESTRRLLTQTSLPASEIAAIGISGHSLGAVPLDGQGRLLRANTPIWSDSRATVQAASFFEKVDQTDWYRLTGNGFPAPLYTLFKTLWYRDMEPDLFRQVRQILGTKDYLNFRLSGVCVTDYSYASGSGVYDLTSWDYSDSLIAASGLPAEIFPPILASSAVIGGLTAPAAEALGLPRGLPVVAGGVDNSCMALGARNLREGDVYNSQGSSSWIAVTSAAPLLNERARPFVFAHVIPGLFNSAVGIFSTGTSLRWIRDQLCPDLIEQAHREGRDAYDLITALAACSPPGARGLLFHPNMGGGSSLDPSMELRGAFLNLDLGHTRADLLRAALEGIAFQGRLALDVLSGLTPISSEMVVVGGGSRSPLWRQIHADAYGKTLLKTNIDQQAAALGAAALAAVGVGLWPNFDPIDRLHQVEQPCPPNPVVAALYNQLLPVFRQASIDLSDLGQSLARISTN
jgi:xylulokinase